MHEESQRAMNIQPPENVPTPPVTPPQKTGTGYFLWEIIKFAAISVAIVAPIRLFIVSPFIVSGASMEPTFDTGHYLIVDEISYRFEKPERGDVVVFRYPGDPGKFLIKRIVGLPGETVLINHGDVIIKNEQFPAGIPLSEPYIEFPRESESLTTTLTPDEYFVMGDNRNNSADSRLWGPLPAEYITGRALVRLFPISKIGTFPGVARY